MKTAIKYVWNLVLIGVFIFAGLNMPTQVTAGEVSFDFENEITRFYAMPSEDLPTKNDIGMYCPPGWTYEIYEWVETEGGSYAPRAFAQGPCPSIAPPENPNDRLGI